MTRLNRDLAARVRRTVATVYGVEQPWTIALGHRTWSTLDGRTGRYWIASRKVHVRQNRTN